MSIITYFVPYLFLFAAMIKLQAEPAAPDVIRVPGGKPVALLAAGYIVFRLQGRLPVTPEQPAASEAS